jgi:capsular polysaccharide biosynthesis protein
MKIAALALAGVVAALLLTALLDDAYEAEALVAVQGPSLDERQQPTAVVQAETYAQLVESEGFLEQVRAQLAGGRLTSGELEERIDARRRPGTALIEIQAEGPTPAEARGLAADAAGALVFLVRQQARQRATQIEDDLRQRVSSATDEGEVGALQAELARQAAHSVEAATAVVIAARPVEPEDALRKPWARNALLGLLLGTGAGIALSLIRLPHRREARAPAPADATPPEVRIVAPERGARVTGVVALRADASDHESGVAAVRFLVSTGTADWALLAGAEWDTAGIPEGRYWLSAVATDRAGNSASSEPQPVTVS